LAASHPAYNRLGGRIIISMAALLITGVTIQATYLFSSDLSLYWKGLLAVNANELPQSLLTYVHGQFISGGAWWYPLYVIALKMPLPALLIVAIAGFALIKDRNSSSPRVIFVLLPAVIFTLATCAFANNLGVRYMIPVIAFLLVLAGRAWRIFANEKSRIIAGLLLAVWLAISVLRVSPHYLSYFNELTGGPAKGPYFLDDSNIDWGQDLKRLAQYLKSNRVDKVVLGYWGPTPPEYYLGKNIDILPWTYELAAQEDPPRGTYAISVNHLVGIKREKIWLQQALDRKIDWLERFRPHDRIGYSIYIYKFPRTTVP